MGSRADLASGLGSGGRSLNKNGRGWSIEGRDGGGGVTEGEMPKGSASRGGRRHQEDNRAFEEGGGRWEPSPESRRSRSRSSRTSRSSGCRPNSG
ncbi:unnamed protein product [Discosporangium mesarthrocarpum]